MISMKFLTPRLSTESSDISFQKLFSPPVLAAILKFCIKCKSTFILETVWDRVVSVEILTSKISSVNWQVFPKIIFSPFLAAIFEERLFFCINGKTWKIVISTKSLMLIRTLYVLIYFKLAKQYSSEIVFFYFLVDIFAGIQNMEWAFFPGDIFPGGILPYITKAYFPWSKLNIGIHNLIGPFHYADPPNRSQILKIVHSVHYHQNSMQDSLLFLEKAWQLWKSVRPVLEYYVSIWNCIKASLF